MRSRFAVLSSADGTAMRLSMSTIADSHKQGAGASRALDDGSKARLFRNGKSNGLR